MRTYVGVILINSQCQVLAQHRDDKPTILGPNTWSVLGGAQEPGELLVNTAVRELREETGYVLDPSQLQLLTRDEYQTERGVMVQRNVYFAPYDEKQLIQTLEGQEIRFVSPDEFPKLNFYPGHENFFRLALQTRK